MCLFLSLLGTYFRHSRRKLYSKRNNQQHHCRKIIDIIVLVCSYENTRNIFRLAVCDGVKYQCTHYYHKVFMFFGFFFNFEHKFTEFTFLKITTRYGAFLNSSRINNKSDTKVDQTNSEKLS